MTAEAHDEATPAEGSPASPSRLAFRIILWGTCALIVAVSLGLGWLIADIFSREILRMEGAHTAAFVQRGAAARADDNPPESFWAAVGEHVRADSPDIFRVKIYDRSGRIRWSDERALIGRQFKHDDVDKSFRGETVTTLRAATKAEHEFEQGVRVVLEVYSPIKARSGDGVIAVVETYEDGTTRQASIDRLERAVWLIAGAAGLLLWLAVAWVVHRASQIQRRAHQMEREALERRLGLTERLRATGEVAAGIAHDLNNLFTTMLGRIDLMKADGVGSVSSLDTLERTAEDAVEIVRRLQELARHRVSRPFEPFDPNELLSSALKMTEPRWRRRQHVSTKVIQGDVPPLVGRPAELREVLVNLILNAIDAMPEGGMLTLSSRVDGDRVVLEIADTGSGMPAEVRKRIFDPFFTTKPEGTGLGLSVAYGIIRRHRGEIAVESEVGRGSVFRVLLPLPRSVKPVEV